jgi:4-hydroxyphenylacetate 3-monooxygenase
MVHLGGEVVRDVTRHPAFAGAVRTVAGLYDLAAEPDRATVMRRRSPELGEEISTFWLVPRSRDDLVARRRAHQAWQERTLGLMGRTPDHVAAFFAGFAGRPELFARAGAEWADRLLTYYRWAAREQPYLAYAVLPPQGDRSKPAHQQPNPHHYAGVVAERDGGIVLRGAQGIATGAAIADEVFVSSIVPLSPGDEAYAISVVVPVGTPGLVVYPRRPFATAGQAFDYPLSSRFDETDAMVVLHDVFVPWERVFVYRDVQLTQAQFFETAAHTLGNFQALVRLEHKLRFLAGLARAVCQAHGTDGLPPVQSQLGQLAAYAATVEGLVAAAAAEPMVDEQGVAHPDPRIVNAGLVVQQLMVSNAVALTRELVGAGPIAVPASAEIFRSDAADDVRVHYAAGLTPAEDRLKLLKLVWDLVGSEFGGRQAHYEVFYAGAPFITQARNGRVYDWDRAADMVRRCLEGYGLDTGLEAGRRAG